MTGKEILQEEFEKSGMRGYKAEQVDEFLRKISSYVDEQQVEINDLTYKLKILAEKVEEYKSEEGNIRDALLGAQKLGTSIMNEAKAKSESMLLEAKTVYDDMMTQARIKSEANSREMLQKATSELNDLKRESERERVTFEKMKKEVSSFKASILKQYKTHLDLLTSLPSITNPQATPPAPEPPVAPQVATPVAPREDTRPTILSTEDRIKDTTNTDIEPKSMFDQDSNNEIVNITYKKSEDTSSDSMFARPQTFTSEILTNEKELDQLDKEEMAQTKEFLNESENKKQDEKKDEEISDFILNESTADKPEKTEDEQQEFKINMGTAHQRPNYMEKFGKLEFGGFSNEK